MSHSRHRTRTGPTGSALGVAGGLLGAIVVAAALSGGSFALWNDAHPVDNLTVDSGTLTISATDSFDTAAWSNLLPGESIRQPFTITNTGNIPAVVAATPQPVSAGFEIRLAAGTCPASALGGGSQVGVAVPLGTLAPAANMTVCTEVRLTASAIQGSTSAIGVLVRGDQE